MEDGARCYGVSVETHSIITVRKFGHDVGTSGSLTRRCRCRPVSTRLVSFQDMEWNRGCGSVRRLSSLRYVVFVSEVFQKLFLDTEPRPC